MRLTPSVSIIVGDSDRPTDRLAWIAATLSMLGLILTLSGTSLGALLLLAATVLLCVVRGDRCLRLIGRSPELWAFPAFAAVSTVWSVAPVATLRATAELSITIGAAILCAGFLRPREFLSAMSVGLFICAVMSLVFGHYVLDGMTGETVFAGIFASKNTMAAFMSFLAIVAAAVLADREQPTQLRLLAIGSLLLSIPLMLRADSTGAVVTTIGSFAALALTVAFARLRSSERQIVLSCVAAVAVPIALVTVLFALNGTLSENWSNFLTGVLGKDATLTGRTLLWQMALDEVARRPFYGTGYYAFWLQGNPLAEAIWRHFDIMTRAGFSFHDTYMEIAVELGWIGVAVLVVMLAQALQRSIRLALADRGWATAALFALVFCLVARSIGEVDVPYPFSAGTFLLFAAASYGADYAALVRGRAGKISAAPGTWPPLAADQRRSGA